MAVRFFEAGVDGSWGGFQPGGHPTLLKDAAVACLDFDARVVALPDLVERVAVNPENLLSGLWPQHIGRDDGGELEHDFGIQGRADVSPGGHDRAVNQAEEVAEEGVDILSVRPMVRCRYQRPIGSVLDGSEQMVGGKVGTREAENGAHRIALDPVRHMKLYQVRSVT